MHFVIIGNGVAGTTAAMTLRKRHAPERAKITLIGDESPYFFSRTALMYAYMDRLRRRDLEPYERDVYRRQKIDRIEGRVVDIDANAHRIELDGGTHLRFDRCLVAVGAKPRMVPFEGLNAIDDGLVTFVTLDDLDDCERLTWSTEQAVVIGGGLIGVELAECFVHHGLEVTFLVREPYYWPAALAAEEGEMISDHIRSHGVDLRHETECSLIESDDTGRVCAVQTDGGDRIPCQMLGIAIGVVPRVDWLRQVSTPPKIDFGLCVDRAFRSSLPDIFGAGDCVEIDMGDDQPPRHEPIWYAARRHGELAAKSMLGDDIEYDPPIFYNSSKFFDVEYTTVGEVQNLPQGAQSLYRRLPEAPVSQRIIVDDRQRVIGFNMIGSRWDHTILSTWIAEKRSLDYVREHLKTAQFDVEFGRLDLGAMNEEMRSL